VTAERGTLSFSPAFSSNLLLNPLREAVQIGLPRLKALGISSGTGQKFLSATDDIICWRGSQGFGGEVFCW
jgi:hypothetical protein